MLLWPVLSPYNVYGPGPDTVRGERHVDYHGHNESPINLAISDIAAKHPQVSLRMRVQGGDHNAIRRVMLVSEHEDPVALNQRLDQAEQDLRDFLASQERALEQAAAAMPHHADTLGRLMARPAKRNTAA